MKDFKILTSLRYDPLLLQSQENTRLSGRNDNRPSPLYMFRYHRDRLLDAAKHFQWDPVVAKLDGPAGLVRFEEDVLRDVEGFVDQLQLNRNSQVERTQLYDQQGPDVIADVPLKVCFSNTSVLSSLSFLSSFSECSLYISVHLSNQIFLTSSRPKIISSIDLGLT